MCVNKYFTNCETIEDVKAIFKILAKELHPDCVGNAEGFKEMMLEYQIVFEKLKNIHADLEGKTYTKETHETPEKFADIIGKIIFFDGVVIELIGNWLWLSGDTYPYKEQIKAAGFHYSKSKRSWYYNGQTEKTYKRGRYSLNGLREKWGSETIKTKKQLQLANAM